MYIQKDVVYNYPHILYEPPETDKGCPPLKVRVSTYIIKIKNFKQPYISRLLVEAHNVIILLYIIYKHHNKPTRRSPRV